MTSDPALDRLPLRWLWINVLGWLLGLALLVVLALLSDLAVTGEAQGQAIVGVGIGLGVGLVQALVLRRWLGGVLRWTAASTVGLGGLFVIHDVATAAGRPIPFSLPLYVIFGGLVTGLWQAALLRRASSRARWWIAVSLAGWGVPAVCMALGDTVRPHTIGFVTSFATIFLGGGMLGAVTGNALRWILRDRAAPVGGQDG